MCILLCKSTRYNLTGYISLVIKLNILNHMMILASVDYSYTQTIIHGGEVRVKTIWIGWSLPSSGWAALISNSCCIQTSDQVGSGGIFRDHEGQ